MENYEEIPFILTVDGYLGEEDNYLTDAFGIVRKSLCELFNGVSESIAKHGENDGNLKVCVSIFYGKNSFEMQMEPK